MKQENIQLFTPKEVMDILKIKDKRTLYSLMESGELGYIKVGKQYRYTEQNIQDLYKVNSSENIKY